MGHELQLKLDVSVKSTTSGKNQSIESPSGQDSTELKPFSSALDEQLEKQPVEQKKTPKPQASEKVEEAQTAKSKDLTTEEVVMQDGNILPTAETEAADIDLVLTEEVDIETSVKIDASVSDVEDVESDVTLDAEHNEAKELVVDQPKDAVVLQAGSVVLPTKSAKPASTPTETEKSQNTNANIIAGSKRPILRRQQIAEHVQAAVVNNGRQDDVAAGSEDKKQQGQILRSDILNALNSKLNGGGDKIEGTTSIKTDKVIAAQSQLLEKPIADLTKVVEQLTQRKVETPQLRAAPERHVSGLVTALTQGLTSAATTTAVQATTAGQPVLAMQPAMQSEAWGRVLSSRVVWMAREGIQQAELRLNPAKLGPVEVKLHMNNELANVTFVAQNAATRDALEQALPRLRESLQENGMDLANANVSDQETEQNNDEEKPDNSSTITTMANDELDAENDSIESDDLELGVSVFA